jgi:predicted transcriptional regulator
MEARGPADELVVTAVGPLTSGTVGGVLAAAAWAAGPFVHPVADALAYLAWLNVALALFNLVPGYPLDGGRILRSVFWAATGSLTRATRTAASVGHAVGLGMVAVGVLGFLSGGVGGLWLAAIGWFLSQAARASLAEVEVRRLLAGLPAEEVMSRPLVTVPAGTSVRDAVEEYFLPYDHSAFPVVDDGHTLGWLTLRAVRQVPPEQRVTHVVTDCMTPIDDVPVVERSTSLPEVLDRLGSEEAQRVLVADHGSVLGIVTPRDVARRVQRAEEPGVEESDSQRGGRWTG